MHDPSYVILYVNSPTTSAAFYTNLFGRSAVEASPNFALFVLESGVKFGLWARHTVEPAATTTGGGVELAICETDADAVRRRHAEWCARGLGMAQAPTQMDFGYTFVALDPDGHRLRVFAPAAT
jgi:predicted enzyme related to lactoylglutathione lyase